MVTIYKFSCERAKILNRVTHTRTFQPLSMFSDTVVILVNQPLSVSDRMSREMFSVVFLVNRDGRSSGCDHPNNEVIYLVPRE